MPGAATFFRCLSLAVLLLARAPAAHGWQAPAAEKPAEPNLDEILRHLENNFIQYHASIPSFFCDEHVVSGIRRGSTPLEVIRADSIFRLKREGSGKRTRLIESREIKTVNGKPAKESEALRGPALLSGAFNIATAMIAYDEKPCFTYRLSESRRHPQYVIEYATKTPNQRDKRCAVTEPTSGRAFVDPATMQITRIEARTPHHPMPGFVTGLWTWSVDYGKVVLNGKTFWLPKKISSFATSDLLEWGDQSSLQWSFDATYSKYHELTVTSRILP